MINEAGLTSCEIQTSLSTKGRTGRWLLLFPPLHANTSDQFDRQAYISTATMVLTGHPEHVAATWKARRAAGINKAAVLEAGHTVLINADKLAAATDGALWVPVVITQRRGYFLTGTLPDGRAVTLDVDELLTHEQVMVLPAPVA